MHSAVDPPNVAFLRMLGVITAVVGTLYVLDFFHPLPFRI
jgi:hypothetical protein